MIKQLPLLLLFGFLWSQDTLITTKGVIYSGKIISSTEKYVDFLPSSFKYSTKVSKDEIKELFNNSGGNEISLDSKSASDKTYSLPNSPIIGKIKQESNLTSSNSYDFSKTGKVLVGMGGLLIVSCHLESQEDKEERLSKMTQDEQDKEFKISKFMFKGFPNDQWVVKVFRTWDDGEGYKGNVWRDVGVFDSKEECETWVSKQTLINVEV